MASSNVRSIELIMSVELPIIKPVSCDINYEDEADPSNIFNVIYSACSVFCTNKTRPAIQCRRSLNTVVSCESNIFVNRLVGKTEGKRPLRHVDVDGRMTSKCII